MSYTLITGASTGIGKEMAYLYAAKGQPLILVARSIDKLEVLKSEIEKKNQTSVHCFQCDLSKLESTESLCQQITNKNLKVSRLINNAGVGRYGHFLEDSLQGNIEMMTLNMSSLVYLTHYFVAKMKEDNNGEVLNIASVAAFVPGAKMNVYYASKAFVLHFTEALAVELAETKLKVSVLCPGPVKTNFFDNNNLDKVGRLDKMPFIQTGQEVALIGIKGLESGKVIIYSSFVVRLLATLASFSPRSLVRKLTYNVNKGS